MRSRNVHPDRKSAEVPCIGYRYRQASQVLAFLVATLGLLGFCGWAFHVPSLTYIRPAFQSMKVNTALSFLCLGSALWLAHNDRRQRSRRILALLVVIIAAATLVEYALHLNLGIDELFFRDTRAPSLSAYPGRMGIATALCFVLLGLAVAFLGLKKALALQRALVAPCFVLSLVALCGYLYGVKSLYAITAFSTMALHTAAGLMAACLSYFLARPDEGIMSIAASDSNSGLLLRRLVPAIIAVPILIGWLSLAGERANLYDPPFGIVLQVLGSVGCLTFLTMLAVRSMHRDEVAGRQVAEALKESEEKFRGLFRDAGVGMVVVSSEGHFLAANKTFCDYFGYTEEELLAKTVQSITFPEDWPAFSQQLSEALAKGRGFQWFQKRCLDKSERIVYTESSASVIRDREGHPQYLVGAVLDITKRKEAEEALSGMTRKLVEAQEQERARIARELHDDITQRLAMLAIDIEQGQQNLDVPSEVRERASELSERAKEISNDIQALSHELHSSNLEYLGIVGGMRSWCNEFGKRQGMEVEFKSSGLRNAPPREISLCLFRVLQEALHNAAKHSEMKRFDVQLREVPGEIQLIVSDLGKGFDAAAMQGRGLGITSMQERVRLVGGTIVIDSEPLAGTTIRVRVPLGSGHDSQRAAG